MAARHCQNPQPGRLSHRHVSALTEETIKGDHRGFVAPGDFVLVASYVSLLKSEIIRVKLSSSPAFSAICS